MIRTSSAAAAILSLGLCLCLGTAGTRAAADPTATRGVPDTDNVLPRFITDIWPAVEGDRGYGQGSPQHNRYTAIRDPTLDIKALDAVGEAKRHLGKVGRDTLDTREISFPVGNLDLASATLTSLEGALATVSTCYTFTSENDETKVDSLAAFRADFHLHKTDVWYLNAITDDHPVADCNTTTP